MPRAAQKEVNIQADKDDIIYSVELTGALWEAVKADKRSRV